MKIFDRSRSTTQPLVIAGPCMAESKELLDETAQFLRSLSQKLGFELIFKSSFDKANRTSVHSYRGPGMKTALNWLQSIKERFGLKLLTDVHECHQVEAVAEVVDVLQIPAFLCRQTDLVVAATQSKRAVNIKKGQFLSPDAMKHLSQKVEETAKEHSMVPDYALTERGCSFGYKDLIVDLRSFAIMNKLSPNASIIFDITHSVQQPSGGGSSGEVSGGLRSFAPLLARSVAASGYVDGFFLEVHQNPNNAKSDAAVQLSFKQAELLLTQSINILKTSKNNSLIDSHFE